MEPLPGSAWQSLAVPAILWHIFADSQCPSHIAEQTQQSPITSMISQAVEVLVVIFIGNKPFVAKIGCILVSLLSLNASLSKLEVESLVDLVNWQKPRFKPLFYLLSGIFQDKWLFDMICDFRKHWNVKDASSGEQKAVNILPSCTREICDFERVQIFQTY